jgi:hypothetical protein
MATLEQVQNYIKGGKWQMVQDWMYQNSELLKVEKEWAEWQLASELNVTTTTARKWIAKMPAFSKSVSMDCLIAAIRYAYSDCDFQMDLLLSDVRVAKIAKALMMSERDARIQIIWILDNMPTRIKRGTRAGSYGTFFRVAA